METATLENNVEQSTTSELSFQIEKEVLLNGLRIVERATAQNGYQPVLANILFDAADKTKINLYATDFDMTISTSVEANVSSLGKITLPAKKIIDIVSRLNDGIINF
jgi:DNA polymerase-3 subunit beta